MSPRSWIARNPEPIIAALLFGLWVFGYYLVGSFFDPADAYELNTVADESIPFVPIFIYPYLALYSVFLLPFFLVRDRQFFRVIAWSYITVMIFCYLLFWSFPVMMRRPEIQVVDFTHWVIDTVYRSDVPANCFPSMHAAMSMMSALSIYHVDRRRGAIVLLVTMMIGASAILVKQHYIADILAGYAIAAISFYAYFKQRILEVITPRLKRVPQAIEHIVDEALEKRLEGIIDRRVEEKFKSLMAEWENSRRTPPSA